VGIAAAAGDASPAAAAAAAVAAASVVGAWASARSGMEASGAACH
jgi:hypothetical protein